MNLVDLKVKNLPESCIETDVDIINANRISVSASVFQKHVSSERFLPITLQCIDR